ncbi:hypothetical protein KM043_018171 [Ampulex compressa]|nr:hypothetical protein KM043_018171 [Ampulex compressa]
MAVNPSCLLLQIFVVSLLLALITLECSAYPHKSSDDSDSSSSSESSESSEGHAVLPTTPKATDDVAALIDQAYKNGELLRPDEWRNNRRPAGHRSLHRRTSPPQDETNRRGMINPNTKTGQRRLFNNHEGSLGETTVHSDGKIIFPTDGTLTNGGLSVNSKQVPICRGSTFCESATHYPQDLVNQAIRRNDSLKFLAGVDIIYDLGQRMGESETDVLCAAQEQVVYPKSAENKQKEWHFVVNQDNFQQGIRIEKCLNENSDCEVIDGIASGYKTSCKQKYIYRQLASITNDGDIAPDTFRFPSSCCCHAKFTGNPLTRMGLPNTASRQSQTSVPRTRRRK